MTHSLHRRGDPEQLRNDYIILVTAAANINNEGAKPKISRVLDILWDTGPSNIGSNETGTVLSGVTREIIRENLTNIPRIRANFNSRAKIWKAMEAIRDEDFGLSVTLQGPREDIEEECEKLGIKPHSANLSLDVWGKKDKLPSEEVLAYTTMCGHGLIAESLVEHVLERVKSGKMTPEQGVVKMGSPCVCGFFNPERALALLKKAAPGGDEGK